MTEGSLHRIAAFTDDPAGGNPAGVWVGNELPSAAEMQQIAAEVGFSETAFVAPRTGRTRTVRYYSPEAEVSFCGHATSGAGWLLGSKEGGSEYEFVTAVGPVHVGAGEQEGHLKVSLTSVGTEQRPVHEPDLAEALAALNWSRADLDLEIPPVVAYAGAWHLVLAASTRDRLADLDYDFERLKNVMLKEDLTTLQLIWRESESVFLSRNPFPVGGVVEDPATGAAAAAFGGYLRDAHLIEVPTRFEIHQGDLMGRPSRLTVEVPSSGGIVVWGTAVDMGSS